MELSEQVVLHLTLPGWMDDSCVRACVAGAGASVGLAVVVDISGRDGARKGELVQRESARVCGRVRGPSVFCHHHSPSRLHSPPGTQLSFSGVVVLQRGGMQTCCDILSATVLPHSASEKE